jgi:hypothetical protein
MNPLQAIQNLEKALQSSERPTRTNAADGPLGAFEDLIDKTVAQRNHLSKLINEANLEKARIQAQKLAEYRRKLAFLSSEAQEAELQANALAGSNVGPDPAPGSEQLSQFKREEAVFWRAKVHHLAPPKPDNDSIGSLLEP